MPEVTMAYSNNARISSRFYDVLIEFKTRHSTGSIESELWVYMSPQHAKAFSEALSKQIEKYEDTYGKIKIPTEQEMKELVEQGKVHLIDLEGEKQDG